MLQKGFLENYWPAALLHANEKYQVDTHGHGESKRNSFAYFITLTWINGSRAIM